VERKRAVKIDRQNCRGFRMDFSIFYKEAIDGRRDGFFPAEWDLFISAFNRSQRVLVVYDRVKSSDKRWIVFPEYAFTSSEIPSSAFQSDKINESEFIIDLFDEINVDISNLRVCIDITGFIRPHLIFLVKCLKIRGIRSFDVIYSEPVRYVRKAETKFSDEVVTQVRQVQGFEGIHVPDTRGDVLIIGSGYDHELIAQLAQDKYHAEKFQIIGFPSLRPEMFQENLLRASKVSELMRFNSCNDSNVFYAPASDPFVTAGTLVDIVKNKPFTNLYLGPVSTKAQVLGFALFHLLYCQNLSASIIFPFCRRYEQETSEGVGKIWKYTIEI
jgi:hypothetical protein